MTLPEVSLWQRLKGSPDGVRFRKQHPIDPYIADFYCVAVRLVVEVDGEVHNRGDQPSRDEQRDRFLTNNGYHVLRVPAATILKNADDAAAAVVLYAQNPLRQSLAAPATSPSRGGF